MNLLNLIPSVTIYLHRILLLEVVWFQSYKSMIFFGHPEVTDFYMKLKLGTYENSSSTTVYIFAFQTSIHDIQICVAHKDSPDPFIGYNRYQRKDLCDLLLTANLYTLPGPLVGTRDSNEKWRVMQNYQEVGHNRGMPEEALGYIDWWMTTGLEYVRVKFFPCLLDSENIVSLTYGFQPHHMRMFVLTMTRADFLASAAAKMVAVLEANPIFQGVRTSPHYIKHRFERSFEASNGASTSSAAKPELSLTFLGSPIEPKTVTNPRITSEFQHFRLCCSVGNELENDQDFGLDTRAYNFVYPMNGVREQVKAILDGEDQFVAYAYVLPCAINLEWSRPQFYLLRDRYEPSSVFVFKPFKTEKYGESLRFVGVVDQILSLHDE